ncbi:hypothetical protein [Ruegeria sp. EL01]|jgi:hypothetical protein|uniref:hypothetical protein n=1 Tax=Ruegeria sp. EL01 TaxID=2107578 RepID=UPI000EA82991|nr:hypothetical protein [Ruegeria sp. EL01]
MPHRKNFPLITQGEARDLVESGKDYEFRYDLVELGQNGRPQYICIYRYDGKDNVLISERATSQGVVPRRLSLFPGLFNFHTRFRQGTDITLHNDLTITTDGVRGHINLDFDKDPDQDDSKDDGKAK